MILRIKDTDFRNANGKLEMCELGKYIDLYKNNEDIDVLRVCIDGEPGNEIANEAEFIWKYLKENTFQPVSISAKWNKEKKFFYDFVFFCCKY